MHHQKNATEHLVQSLIDDTVSLNLQEHKTQASISGYNSYKKRLEREERRLIWNPEGGINL